jgi:lipoic acid synthetase
LRVGYCASGSVVRSSYRAGELFVENVLKGGESVAEAREQARTEA